jgi:glycosyltransferase involved in cell wall biosynthesis
MTPSFAKESQPRPNTRDFAPIQLAPLPERPLVSVLIPSYNYGRYVGITLQSLLDQTYPNFEAIVCDDGSSDNSVEIIQKYAARDSRIKFFPKEHGGIISTMNMAYVHSQGEIISLLDSDDVFKPSKLQKVVAAFRNNPRSGIFMNAVQRITSEGRPFGQPIPRGMEDGWLAPTALRRGGESVYPPGPGLSFRRQAVAGLFPVPLPTSIAHATDAYLVLCAQFMTEITMTTECLTDYRIHGANAYGLRESWAFPTKPDIEENELFFSAQRDFLRRAYGSDVAGLIRLEDFHGYWERLLSYRVLQGRQAGSIRPYSVEEMIGHVMRNTRERRIWRFIMKLPDPLAKRLYGFWRGSSAWERAIRALLRRWL